jgi:GDP-D-mannose dehydratase
VQLFLHYGDMTDATNLTQLMNKIRPDEVYNLAAQSHVAVSFEQPEYTSNGTSRVCMSVYTYPVLFYVVCVSCGLTRCDNLAAQSHVVVLFEQPEYTSNGTSRVCVSV